MVIIHKKTGVRYMVFDIKNKKGYPYFLIYKNKEWKYISAKNFTPFDKW